MKKQYLYQGWAGNTYSHKCNSDGEASTIEYLDVSGVNQEIYFTTLLIVSFVSKNKENGVVGILPSAATVGYNNSLIISLAIDFSFKTSNGTILELLLNMGITQEQLDAIPRITKEEFYSLETITPSGNKFTLIVNDPESGQKHITYTYKEGQTWEDWIASENNIGGLTIHDLSDFGYSLNVRGGVITEICGSTGVIIYNAENRTNPANPTDTISTKIYYCDGPEL